MEYQAYTRHNFSKIPAIRNIGEERLNQIKIVSRVLPFKTNNYVVENLIDWDNFENDPIFILNFPQKAMLRASQYRTLSAMIRDKENSIDINNYVNEIRMHLNPHPAGQLEHNVPTLNGEKLTGIQHKYRETMLFFPSQGQTCHAFCTFCFRWPQFTGMNELKFSMKKTDLMVEYLRQNPSITDILITGGDPMVMKASLFKRLIDAILDARIPNLKTIRIGTKSLSFWPYRYLTDKDSGQLLDVFRQIADSGIHLAFMAHFNHYRELETEALEEAVATIRSTGAQIRTQSPLLRHINNDPGIWARMWRRQVDLGMIPYYMFVARDTGAQGYFGITLEQAHHIFNEAYKDVSGICRTVRGPSMSAGPGKVQIAGISEIKGEKVFVLRFLQGRDPDWVGKPFFARFDPDAQWLDDLEPAFGENEFFFETDYRKLLKVDTLPGRRIETENKRYA